MRRDQKIKNDFISKNSSQKFSFEKYVENLKCNQSSKQPEKSKTEKLFQKIENVKNWNLDLNGEQFNAIYGWAFLFLYTVMCVLFDLSPLVFCYTILSIYSFLAFRNRLPSVLESYNRIKVGVLNVFAGEFGFQQINPTVAKMSQAETRQRREKFAEQDIHFDKHNWSGGVINLQPRFSAEAATHYNFKVKCQVNDLDEVIAEIDSDSHLSLISTEYFDRLNDMDEIEYIDEPPPVFNGLGSVVHSQYSPIMLIIQIGRVRMKNRFVVTDLLKTSPLLLGTDFIIKNDLSFAPHSEGQWFVTLGTLDNILGRVPALVTNKINLVSAKMENFLPFETKKISVTANLNDFQRDLFIENGVLSSLTKHDLSHSPFVIIDENLGEQGTVIIKNTSPVDTVLPCGIELASTELDLSAYSVKSQCSEIKNVSVNSPENNLDMDTLEENLEPGFGPPKVIDKESELQFIKDHPSIPEEMKADFIEFLSAREDLFSGTEFSKNHFPRDKYQHEVELLEPLTHLSSRPFPVAGIRLQQLKDDIQELVKNGILSPGDSPFTSPVFYVLKKAGAGQSAQKGRLCFDYRRYQMGMSSL